MVDLAGGGVENQTGRVWHKLGLLHECMISPALFPRYFLGILISNPH